jgi:hypothetical protein
MAERGTDARSLRTHDRQGLRSALARLALSRAGAQPLSARKGSEAEAPGSQDVARVRGKRARRARADPATALRRGAPPPPGPSASAETVLRWACDSGGAVPSSGGTTCDGWKWVYFEGRYPAKNHTKAISRSGVYFLPKNIKLAQQRARAVVVAAFHGNEWIRALGADPLDPAYGKELEFRLVIFRRTPEEARIGKRNRRRGDPASAHEFLIDAFQGQLYEDDECLTVGGFLELRCQAADGYLLFLRARRESAFDDFVRSLK